MTDYSGCLGKFQWVEDRFLLSPKIIYFVVSATFYSLYMFRAKFIKDYLGLGDSQYGDIAAIMALVSFAFMTIWGSLADALGRHRFVLMSLAVLLAGSLELCTLVVNITSVQLRFYLSAVVLSLYSFFSCGLMPLTDYLTLRILSGRPGFSKDMYGRQRLWGTISYGATTYIVGLIIKASGLWSLFYVVPLCSILMVFTLLLLAPGDKPKKLSQIFHQSEKSQKCLNETELSSKPKPMSENPMEKMSLNESSINEKSVEETKPTSSEISPLPLSSSSPLDNNNNNRPLTDYKTIPVTTEEEGSDLAKPQKRRRPIWQLLSNPSFMFMLFAVFMTGSARAVMTTFLGKYWDDKGLLPDQLGLGAIFGILLEIVIFFFGPWCIQVFGTYWMLVFAQLAMAVRCWIYVVLPINQSTVWMVYCTELLKGVAFGFTQIAGVKLASDAAPPGVEATAQALYTSVYSQLPAVLTAFAGGRVYGSMGPHILFFITAVVMTVALGLFTLKYMIDGSIRFPCQGRPSVTDAPRTTTVAP